MLQPNLYSENFFLLVLFFFFNDTATTEIYTLSLHDALPICPRPADRRAHPVIRRDGEPHDLSALTPLGEFVVVAAVGAAGRYRRDVTDLHRSAWAVGAHREQPAVGVGRPVGFDPAGRRSERRPHPLEVDAAGVPFVGHRCRVGGWAWPEEAVPLVGPLREGQVGHALQVCELRQKVVSAGNVVRAVAAEQMLPTCLADPDVQAPSTAFTADSGLGVEPADCAGPV